MQEFAFKVLLYYLFLHLQLEIIIFYRFVGCKVKIFSLNTKFTPYKKC